MLFREQREDLSVRFFQDGPPAVKHTWWSGRAARGERLVYRSDQAPGGFGRPERGTAALSSNLFEPVHSAFSQAMRRHGSGPVVSALGVAFEQRIMVARGGSEPVEDLRSGARMRFECRLGGAMAVTEMVHPFDRPDEAAKALLNHLERRLDAIDAPGGELPVVFAPGVGGVLVHEIVGHALEGDMILAGRSWLAQLEERVAPRDLVIVDDPRRGRAAWKIDDEGVPARAVSLIRDGVVAGRLLDSRSALLSGGEPTGHGRCSSFREPIMPRMGCTFIAPGPLAPDELLQGIGRGLYVRRMEAANTDAMCGHALFRVTDSDLIRDGKIDAPLKPHLLHVDGAAALASMDRIADDLRFDTCVGSCHRDGQPLATSVGAPTIRIGAAGVK
jgi:TldD protein